MGLKKDKRKANTHCTEAYCNYVMEGGVGPCAASDAYWKHICYTIVHIYTSAKSVTTSGNSSTTEFTIYPSQKSNTNITAQPCPTVTIIPNPTKLASTLLFHPTGFSTTITGAGGGGGYGYSGTKSYWGAAGAGGGGGSVLVTNKITSTSGIITLNIGSGGIGGIHPLPYPTNLTDAPGMSAKPGAGSNGNPSSLSYNGDTFTATAGTAASTTYLSPPGIGTTGSGSSSGTNIASTTPGSTGDYGGPLSGVYYTTSGAPDPNKGGDGGYAGDGGTAANPNLSRLDAAKNADSIPWNLCTGGRGGNGGTVSTNGTINNPNDGNNGMDGCVTIQWRGYYLTNTPIGTVAQAQCGGQNLHYKLYKSLFPKKANIYSDGYLIKERSYKPPITKKNKRRATKKTMKRKKLRQLTNG